MAFCLKKPVPEKKMKEGHEGSNRPQQVANNGSTNDVNANPRFGL